MHKLPCVTTYRTGSPDFKGGPAYAAGRSHAGVAAWGGIRENGVLGAENSRFPVPGRTPESRFKTCSASGSRFRHAGVGSPPLRVCSPETLGAPVPCAPPQRGLAPDAPPERRLLPRAYFLPAQRFRFLTRVIPLPQRLVPPPEGRCEQQSPLPVCRFEARIRYRQFRGAKGQNPVTSPQTSFFVPRMATAYPPGRRQDGVQRHALLAKSPLLRRVGTRPPGNLALGKRSAFFAAFSLRGLAISSAGLRHLHRM